MAQGLVPLTDEEIAERLEGLPGWAHVGDEITGTYAVRYHAGVAVIVHVADRERRIGHHADSDLRIDSIRLGITTHDVGRQLTAADFDLAARVDAIVAAHEEPPSTDRELQRPDRYPMPISSVRSASWLGGRERLGSPFPNTPPPPAPGCPFARPARVREGATLEFDVYLLHQSSQVGSGSCGEASQGVFQIVSAIFDLDARTLARPGQISSWLSEGPLESAESVGDGVRPHELGFNPADRCPGPGGYAWDPVY